MSDPEKKQPVFGLHYGDLGVVALAVLFLLAFLGLMFAPAPLKGLDKFDAVAARDREATTAKLEKARRQKEIDDAVASGEVTVGIAPKH